MNTSLRLGVALALIVVLSAVSCSGIHIVHTGYRGVKTHFGEVIGEALPEGLYFVNPLTTHIEQMDTRVQSLTGRTECYTKDVQKATIAYTLNYRLDQSKAHIVFRNVGVDWADKLIPQVVLENIKRELGQYDAVDLISQRDQAARKIEELVTTELGRRDVIASGLQLTNIDYTKEFEDAVEQKVVAQQKAIEEQNRTAQIEQQARQKVISAEAEAKSMQIRAQALESNPKLVEWEAVQKWDGHMPQYMLGSGAMPFISLDKK